MGQKNNDVKKKIFIATAATVGTIAIAKGINEITVKPASRIIKILFKGKYLGAKNYEDIKKITKVYKNISYGDTVLGELAEDIRAGKVKMIKAIIA